MMEQPRKRARLEDGPQKQADSVVDPNSSYEIEEQDTMSDDGDGELLSVGDMLAH